MFFENVVRLGVKEFHGLQDDLKIIRKKLTPGRLSGTEKKLQKKSYRVKKRRHYDFVCTGQNRHLVKIFEKKNFFCLVQYFFSKFFT